MRELTRGVPSRISLSLIRATNPDMRHRPSFISGSGFAGHSCSFFPEGRAERQGVSPRPRRPHVVDAGIPHAERGTRAVVQPNAEDR